MQHTENLHVQQLKANGSTSRSSSVSDIGAYHSRVSSETLQKGLKGQI